MLVARNLDETSAIAYKGKRAVHQVVTLQGEIISTSGTMAGGGAKARAAAACRRAPFMRGRNTR
jgi:chromosome segregation ATPase